MKRLKLLSKYSKSQKFRKVNTKKRNIFQIGFYLNFNVNSYPNKPHAVDAELTQPYVSLIINDKYKLNYDFQSPILLNKKFLKA